MSDLPGPLVCHLFAINFPLYLALSTHNQVFIKGKIFVGHAFATLEQFFPPKKYHEIDWLLFTTLKKVMKGKKDFGGNLFFTECPTLAHYQVTQKAASFKWGPEQGEALPLLQVV